MGMLNNGAKARIAGNAMCSASIGPLLWWIARQCVLVDNDAGRPTRCVTRTIEGVSHHLRRRHARVLCNDDVHGLLHSGRYDGRSPQPADRNHWDVERHDHGSNVQQQRIVQPADRKIGHVERDGPQNDVDGRPARAASRDLPPQLGSFPIAYCPYLLLTMLVLLVFSAVQAIIARGRSGFATSIRFLVFRWGLSVQTFQSRKNGRRMLLESCAILRMLRLWGCRFWLAVTCAMLAWPI